MRFCEITFKGSSALPPVSRSIKSGENWETARLHQFPSSHKRRPGNWETQSDQRVASFSGEPASHSNSVSHPTGRLAV
jgi:hypothetical protein